MADEAIKKECLDKEKPDAAELDQFRAGKLASASDNVKCYLKCVSEKSGFFKDGKYVEEKMKALYSASPKKDILLPAFEECKKLKGANDCDTVFQVRLCTMKSLTK